MVFLYEQKTEICDANIKLAGKVLKIQACESRKQQLKGKRKNKTVFNAIMRCTVG